jgi:NTE family protein
MDADGTTNVAIACQGGGSHTAYTAGALDAFARSMPPDHELVGLSGASGGAICAFLSWYGLTTDDAERAGELLDSFWTEIAARSPSDALLNGLAVTGTKLEASGAALPAASPYLSPASRWAQDRIRHTLEGMVDLDALEEADHGSGPRLLVGAVDVERGVFETFEDREVTIDAVLASGALPTVFPAVEVDGHAYWDGLLSENPPLLGLLDGPRAETPDELWIVQVNPQTRDGVPRSLPDIEDRRNELSGNLALNKDVGAIEQVNDWLDAGYLPESEYKQVTVRTLRLDRDLSYASKLDRDPAFVAELVAAGREDAAAFLDRR